MSYLGDDTIEREFEDLQEKVNDFADRWSRDRLDIAKSLVNAFTPYEFQSSCRGIK